MIVKGDLGRLRLQGNILLLQLGDIGDVVLTTPTIRALKNTFPDRRVLVAVRDKSLGLLEDCPWCDRAVPVIKLRTLPSRWAMYQIRFFRDLRAQGIDWAIELRTGTRGAVLAFLSGARVRLGRYAEDGKLWRNRLFTHLVAPDPDLEMDQYVPDHALNICSPLGLQVPDRRPCLVVSSQKEDRVRNLLREAGVRDDSAPVALHPFSLWSYKEWPAHECARLVDHVAAVYRAQVLVTGSAEERGRAEALGAMSRAGIVNLAGRTCIGDLAAVYKACRGFIGVDTAALHIAAAVGTPTLGIFGPSSPVSWAPRGTVHAVASKALSCIPCRRKGCENGERSRCMEELQFEEIQEALDRWAERAWGKGPA